MVSPSTSTLACALCGAALDEHIARLSQNIDQRVQAALRRQHPAWDLAQTACPQCLQGAVINLEQRRSDAAPQANLDQAGLTYGRTEAELLPLPMRIGANPHYTGRGVTIAFLDSGFYPHPDLTQPSNRVLAHIDATLPQPVEQSNFRRAEPQSWHGLMVASVAAGNGFQSAGQYRGVASEANLVLVKTGNRRNRKIPDRDIIRALQWVLEHHERYNIRIVNLSIGGDIPCTGDSTPLDMLVEEAVALGLVIVAAAGNGGVNRIIAPASAKSAVTVGGLDDQNSLDRRYWRMWRSSYGRGVDGVPKPDLVAPSIWVPAPILPHTWVHNEAMLMSRLNLASDTELSRYINSAEARARFRAATLRQPLDEVRRVIRQRIAEQKYVHPHYQHVDGTSMAAPIVSAVAAQMLEANPHLTPGRLKDTLRLTAQPLRFVPCEEQGHGVLDPARAAAHALRAYGGALAGLPVSPHVNAETVTFVFRAEAARQVALVASFNGWRPQAGGMQSVRPGVWQASLPKPPHGVHAYKFLVDQSRWEHDVENSARVADGAGGYHSLLTIA